MLPPTVLEPRTTSVDADLDSERSRRHQLAVRGKIDVIGPEPAPRGGGERTGARHGLGVSVDGTLDPARRRLELAKLEGRSRGLIGKLSGMVELRDGKFRFTDGTEMPMVPN